MENERVLLSAFIQSGAEHFMENINSVLMKKKKKIAMPNLPLSFEEFSLYGLI
jgi:hypothetical protein